MARCAVCGSLVLMTEKRSSGVVGSCWECGTIWAQEPEGQRDPRSASQDQERSEKADRFIMDWALAG